MNAKRKTLLLCTGILLLLVAIAVYYYLPKESQACALFFGSLGLILVIGVLLVIPLCLLLVRYFQKK